MSAALKQELSDLVDAHEGVIKDEWQWVTEAERMAYISGDVRLMGYVRKIQESLAAGLAEADSLGFQLRESIEIYLGD